MDKIAVLYLKESCLFSHRDPEIVKMIGSVIFDI